MAGTHSLLGGAGDDRFPGHCRPHWQFACLFRWLCPELYPAVHPELRRLDMAELADRAQAQTPEASRLNFDLTLRTI